MKHQDSCFRQPREEPFSGVSLMPSLFSLHLWAPLLAREPKSLFSNRETTVKCPSWSKSQCCKHHDYHDHHPLILKNDSPVVTASSVSSSADVRVFCDPCFGTWDGRHSWALAIGQEHTCKVTKSQETVLEITWQRRAGDAQPYSGEDFLQGSASKRHSCCGGAAWSLCREELPNEGKLVAFSHDAPGRVGDMSHKRHCTMLLICEMLSQQWGSRSWKLNINIMLNSPYPSVCASIDQWQNFKACWW